MMGFLGLKAPPWSGASDHDAVCTRRAHNHSGFTLAELLVTIAVGALLLSVGVPSLTAFTKNTNIVTSTNNLLADMHYARDLAITKNRRVVMCPSNSGASCDAVDWINGWIVFVDDDNDGAFDAGVEAIERVTTELSRLSLQPVEFVNSLTYRPNGRAMGATVQDNIGAFVMCDDRGSDHLRVIMVDFGGRPRVTDAAALAAMGATVPTCPDM